MNSVKTLYVGIAFPPKRDPECIQTSRIFKYLSNSESIKLDVLTAKAPVLNMPIDDSFDDADIRMENLYEKKIKENRYTNSIKSRLGLSSFPDFKASFFYQIEKFAQREDIDKPDIIYTRAYPLSSAIAGYRLSLYFDVPLILHLSDPWLLSPLHTYSGILKRKIRSYERKILRRASAVTLTSKLTIERYQNYYPEFKDKFFLQPNVYDDEQVRELPANNSNRKFRLVYTGGIIGNRNPMPLFKAMKSLSERSLTEIEFLIAGEADRPNRSLLGDEMNDSVQYLGPLSLDEAMKLQSSADVLVLFDNQFDEVKDAIYMPSKLLDYMTQRKKILAITGKGGTTDTLLSQHSLGWSFSHNDEEEIADCLRKMLMEWKQGNDSYFSIKEVPEVFSASQNAKFVANLLMKYA